VNFSIAEGEVKEAEEAKEVKHAEHPTPGVLRKEAANGELLPGLPIIRPGSMPSMEIASCVPTWLWYENNFRVADHPTRNGPIWYERSTNMRRHEDWILVGVTAVFRQ
jgi:hypothetical protein